MKLIFLCLSWIQAAEAGWERETFNGATEEENGERDTENDEKRAEDCCQAFITLIQHYRHSKQLLILHFTWFCPARHTTVLTSLGYFFWSISHLGEFLFVCFFRFSLCIGLNMAQRIVPFVYIWVIVTVLLVRSMKEEKNYVFSVSIYNTWMILSRKISAKEFRSFLVLLFCLPPVFLKSLVSVL